MFQDLGFNLDESETDLGVIVTSKKRDATEAGQVAVAILAGVLLGSDVAWDDKQKIRVSLVTRPSGEQVETTTVRVTFQRIVWNSEGDVSRIEQIDERKIYRQFFDKLSKSVFLEAHKV